jgi:hypothetical protein
MAVRGECGFKGLRVGFIDIKERCNNDGGKGGVRV